MNTLFFSEFSFNTALMVMNMILLWSCGLYLIFSEIHLNKKHPGKLLISAVLAAIFLVLISLLSYIAHRNGYSNMVAVISLLLSIAMLGVRLVQITEKNKKAAFPLVLLFLWLTAMLYITMVSRIGEEASPDISINPILAIKKLFNDGASAVINHAFLNAIMFIPLGAILRLLDPEKKLKFRWLFVGVTVSTSVEMIQLIFRLGQCDIMDILSNSLGNIAGFLLTHLLSFCFPRIRDTAM